MAYEDKARKIAKMIYDSLIANKSKLVRAYQNLPEGEELSLRLRIHIRRRNPEDPNDRHWLRICHECVRRSSNASVGDRKAILLADDLDESYREDLE